jgi:hypothetical protein
MTIGLFPPGEMVLVWLGYATDYKRNSNLKNEYCMKIKIYGYLESANSLPV